MMLVFLLTILAFVVLIFFVIYRHRAAVKLEKEHKKLVEAYAQLEVANAKAEESSRMKSNFIQQISHEINTPLNILSGFTQIITMPDVNLRNEEKEEINKGIMESLYVSEPCFVDWCWMLRVVAEHHQFAGTVAV